MNRTEQAVQITAKIYDARATMKRVACGQEYAANVRDYQESIRQAMTAHRCREMEGALHCLCALQKLNNSGVAQTWVLVALAEMLEPS